jgi:hypothetical protein
MSAAFVIAGGGSLAGPAAGAVTAATATPSTSPTPFGTTNDAQPDPNSVSPGLVGFLVIFALAVVVWLLLRNMTGHLRRMRFREEQARRDGEARDGGAHESGRPDGQRPDGGRQDGGRGPAS